MSRAWDDVNARVGGLRSTLLSADTVALLRTTADVPSYERALVTHAVIDGPRGADPLGIEQAIVAMAGARSTLVVRWLGPRHRAVAVLVDIDDRRAIRAMMRGAAQASDPVLRTRGLIPSPRLDVRRLAELARQASVGAVVDRLVAWRHPLGPPLVEVTRGDAPDLFAVEAALAQAFARRARRTVRRDRWLAAFVATTIDIDNAQAALVLSLGPSGSGVERGGFASGGRRLSRRLFARAAGAGGLGGAAGVLRGAFRGTSFDDSLRAVGTGRLATQADWLAALQRWCRRGAVEYPLSAAPTVEYMVRLRAQTAALLEILWRRALQAETAGRAA